MPLADDGELSILQFPAASGTPSIDFIWMPSEHGLQASETTIAEQLTRRSSGVEVLIPEYFTSFFLPASKQALAQVAASSVQAMLEQHAGNDASDHGRTIFIVAADKAAIPAMQALHAIQRKHLRQRIGLILLNPDVTSGPAIPGVTARFHPIVTATNAPIFIIQAEKSPWRHGLFKLENALEQSGSDVFVQVLPGVRDRFYFRPDATSEEEAMAKRLPRLLIQAANLLAPYLNKQRSIPTPRDSGIASANEDNHPTSHRNRELSPYTGTQGKSFQLPNLKGDTKSLKDWRGRVVLLNFWASWCPPCVHEIPSMVALKHRLQEQPFEIVAINLGEPMSDVQDFLSRHPVNFPVLLDSRGTAAKSWQVSAYPTTFLIDANGRIRYALAGGHDWNDPASVNTIRTLLDDLSR